MNIPKLFSLQGRTALITGGSRGLGRMMAEGFLAQGAKVYITARKAEACEQAAAEMSELGECIAIPVDLSTTEGRLAAIQNSEKKNCFVLIHKNLSKLVKKKLSAN